MKEKQMSVLVERWRKLGLYRTLPVFFAIGAAVEWFMINVRVGKETFCKDGHGGGSVVYIKTESWFFPWEQCNPH